MTHRADSSGDRRLAMLVGKISAAFPALSFAHARLEDRGGDHRVVLLDGQYAFRFPRTTDHHLELEIAVLRALQQVCALPTPRYDFVAPDFSFAGYRFLPGTELTPALFASLGDQMQCHILDTAVRFLNILHSLDPGPMAAQNAWRRVWTAAQFTRRGRRRLGAIVQAFPALAAEIAAFYAIYERDRAPHSIVLHGDLTEDHLLLSPDGDGLAGIIDFGDVGLGDPADDLKGFWAYGEAAVAYLLKNYAGSSADPDLKARSRRAYLRYRIDRFAELLDDDGADIAAAEAVRLQALLTGETKKAERE